jgi:anti-sigma factor RsiW
MKGSHPEHARRCRDYLEKLSRYLDDDLRAADRRTIEKHLAACPCCEDVLESLKGTIALCHEKGRPSLPRDVRQRARQRVKDLLAGLDRG